MAFAQNILPFCYYHYTTGLLFLKALFFDTKVVRTAENKYTSGCEASWGGADITVLGVYPLSIRLRVAGDQTLRDGGGGGGRLGVRDITICNHYGISMPFLIPSVIEMPPVLEGRGQADTIKLLRSSLIRQLFDNSN